MRSPLSCVRLSHTIRAIPSNLQGKQDKPEGKFSGPAPRKVRKSKIHWRISRRFNRNSDGPLADTVNAASRMTEQVPESFFKKASENQEEAPRQFTLSRGYYQDGCPPKRMANAKFAKPCLVTCNRWSVKGIAVEKAEWREWFTAQRWEF